MHHRLLRRRTAGNGNPEKERFFDCSRIKPCKETGSRRICFLREYRCSPGSGQVIVGRIKGIQRPPLAPLIPTAKGVSLLIDCGANVDARPNHLVQFAQMGSIYMENVVGIRKPRVAIVNNGAEEEKGNALGESNVSSVKRMQGTLILLEALRPGISRQDMQM